MTKLTYNQLPPLTKAAVDSVVEQMMTSAFNIKLKADEDYFIFVQAHHEGIISIGSHHNSLCDHLHDWIQALAESALLIPEIEQELMPYIFGGDDE